ncbi:MAG: hypothetical protein FH761_16565, partial [Firmicutes bacterium]|nr:hypothetical protein [Bacillota bacterium]
MAQDREKLTPGNFWGDPDNEYEKINRNADRNNALDSDFRSHLTTNTAHNSSDIDDNSGETTGKVTDAIQSLRSSIDSITTADSNADIGVYSIADNSNTNNYEGTVTGLSYFSGLKVNLLTANQNTASSTLNLNSLGAKSIKVLDTKGNKHDLTGKEIYGIAQLEYDGTDFILINGTYADYTPAIYNTSSIFSAGYGTDESGEILDYRSSIKNGQVNVVLRGNTRTNLIPTFDSGEWTLNANVTVDSSTKITLDATDNNQYSNVKIPVKSNTKYTLSVKNFDGGTIKALFYNESTYLTGLQSNENSITLTTTSDTTDILVELTNSNTIDTFVWEEVQFEETEIVKPFITGTKSTLSTRLKSIGKNLFDGELELGNLNLTTGEDSDSSIIHRSKNFINVKP